MIIAIVITNSLNSSSGHRVISEKWAEGFKRKHPSDEILIIHTDAQGPFANAKFLDFPNNTGINIVKMRSPISTIFFSFTSHFGVFGNFLFDWILYPWLYIIMNHKTINNLSKRIDCFLFYNKNDVFSYYFVDPMSKRVVSGEDGLPSSNNGLLFRIGAKTIRLISHKIHFLSEGQFTSFGYGKERDFVLPNGLDGHEFYPLESVKKDLKTKFLYVGRLVRSKGIEELLEAYSPLLFDQRFQLTIVGDGDRSEVVKQISSQKGSGVVYMGHLDRKDLLPVYQESDVFVFLTHHEPFGMVVLEALACGSYCLVSSTMRGVFDEFEALGVLEYVDNTPQMVTKRMLELYGKKLSFDKKMSIHRYISQKYNWDSISEKLYDELVST